jgi:hypothetical protein
LGFGVLAIAWGLGFGAISWQFEYQSDLFAARCIEADLKECRFPCLVHHPEMVAPGAARPSGSDAPLCATAAHLFSHALLRVAHLNGLDPRRPGWRHPSIARRGEFLRRLAQSPPAVARFDRRQRILRWSLLLITAAGLLAAGGLYWPWRG